MSGIERVLCGAAILAACALAPSRPVLGQTVPVGVARVDITPDYPVRLTGYGSRTTESEGVAERIWAKALAIGADAGEGPAVLLMVENCGVPAEMADQVAARLAAKAGLKRERVVVCSTHIHTGPWLRGFLPLPSLEPLAEEHVRHIERYSAELVDRMEQVALAALAARRPARLSWAQGTVKFAMNRRPIKNGRCAGIGVNLQGNVDHSLPLLCVEDEQGKLVALVINYACHCTTLTGLNNELHGDWAGVAQRLIEAEHPGTTALISIGCGADANPEPRGKMEMTELHGRAVADEVGRLLKGKLQPASPKLAARLTRIEIPFGKLPTREEFQARLAEGKKPKASGAARRLAGHAALMLAQMDRGTLPAHVDYLVTVWAFGNDLAMVFLPGEVVSDLALRLKRELDGRRLWVTAYANGVPCYIVSRRMFAEGGYEPDGSMIGYGLPGPLAETVEEQVVSAVKSLVPAGFEKGARPAALKTAPKAAACAWKAGVATVKITPQKMMRMFGYACHNTCLGLYKFCGDYAGYAQEYFEKDHPGVTAMFMMGCGGEPLN